jgi:hypothetical protein
MNRESITPLSFIVELLNPQMRHTVEKTTALFSELKDFYTNCNRPSEGVTEFSISNKSGDEIKRCIIRNDRIIIINDFTALSLDGFSREAEDVIKKTINSLQIPLFVFRQYTIRVTTSLLKDKDARIFLGEKVCSLNEDKLQYLKRPIHGFGVRLVFPPLQTNQNEFNIRIESFLQNTQKIFMENQARFLVPLQTQGNNYWPIIKKELDEVYNFLKNNISDFLTQYNE